MIRIAVVEMKEYTDLIKNKCLNCHQFPETVIVSVFDNYMTFLGEIVSGNFYEVCFLDIQISGINGIDLVKKIHSLNSFIIIVIVTDSVNYVYEGYDAEAFDYILKSHFEERWDRLAKRLIPAISGRRDQVYIIRKSDSVECVLIDKILYICKNGNYAEFILDEGNKIKVRKSMEMIYEEFKKYEYFIRIKRGIIINQKKIRKISSNTIVLENDEKFYIGRLYTERARTEIERFMIKRGEK